MTTIHAQRVQHAGDGWLEPREVWMTCTCGALIWDWQQFYNENQDDPERLWQEHLDWVEDGVEPDTADCGEADE